MAAIGLILFCVGASLMAFCLAKLAGSFRGKKRNHSQKPPLEAEDLMAQRSTDALDRLRAGNRPLPRSHYEPDTPAVASDWWEERLSGISKPVNDETRVCPACLQDPCLCGAYDAEMDDWDW